MTDWKKVNGSQAEKPAEFDETSSSSVVYQRRNVHTIEVENQDGTKVTLWEYEERTLTPSEANLEKNNIELKEKLEIQAATLSEQNDNQLAIMSAISDLYEGMVASNG